MKRIAFAGIVVFLALFFGTCGTDLSDGGVNDSAEYSDWEYVVLPDGSARLTIQLDGTAPFPVSSNPASGNRALNLNVAKRSHDFFEAVFVAPGTSPAPNHVARAVWEIGQTAGIRGVRRGIDYKAFTGSAVTSTTTGASTVLVGRKDGSTGTATLYAVGFLTHIDGYVVNGSTVDGTISTTTRNVTFTVAPLTTKVGYNISLEDPENAVVPANDDAADLNGGIRSTFVTAIVPTTIGDKVLLTNATIANTDHRLVAFSGARYTLFDLLSYKELSVMSGASAVLGTDDMGSYYPVAAKYTIGGLEIQATDDRLPAGFYITTGNFDLSTTIYYWDVDGSNSGTGTTPNTTYNFDILERLAVYQAEGRLQEVIEANLDASTSVVLHNSATTFATDDTNFVSEIPLEIRIREGSEGLFSFTFQTPVYALSKAESDNGGPNAVKWYVRPAHGQAQYLLDNGRDTGGCVLLGINISALGELLEILVRGLGFKN